MIKPVTYVGMISGYSIYINTLSLCTVGWYGEELGVEEREITGHSSLLPGRRSE